MKHYLIGKLILITHMEGEPHMMGKQGIVTHVDSSGQLHGTWGGLAVLPMVDKFIVLEERE